MELPQFSSHCHAALCHRHPQTCQVAQFWDESFVEGATTTSVASSWTTHQHWLIPVFNSSLIAVWLTTETNNELCGFNLIPQRQIIVHNTMDHNHWLHNVRINCQSNRRLRHVSRRGSAEGKASDMWYWTAIPQNCWHSLMHIHDWLQNNDMFYRCHCSSCKLLYWSSNVTEVFYLKSKHQQLSRYLLHTAF